MTHFNDLPFLGRAAERLHELIHAQTAAAFKNLGIIVPVKSCSLVIALREQGSASAADLSRALDCSHQLVLQKIPKLRQLQLVDVEQDPDDARRRNFKLTKEGLLQVEKLQETLPLFVEAYEDLFAEVGDTLSAISTASAALEERALVNRIGPSSQ